MNSLGAGREHWGIRALRELSKKLTGIGDLAAYLIMVCLFIAAFFSIVLALLHAISPSWISAIQHATGPLHAESSAYENVDVHGIHVSRSTQLTIDVLHGIELLFVAPLPFLVFLSLSRYIDRFVRSEGSIDDDNFSNCEHDLHRVKAFIVGLMAASVATDLLRRAIETISLSVAASESLVMVVLVSFWVVLVTTASRHSVRSTQLSQR